MKKTKEELRGLFRTQFQREEAEQARQLVDIRERIQKGMGHEP